MIELTDELLDPGRYKPLPYAAVGLCCRFDAPPRLVAHLTLVHDTAVSLLERLGHAYPALKVDSDAILFGAATHDIGKAVHREELSAPGKLHERCGVELLMEAGIPRQQARFAWTHGNWNDGDAIALEDLLVALADSCWKGKRVAELEDLVAEQLSTQTGEPKWSTYFGGR